MGESYTHALAIKPLIQAYFVVLLLIAFAFCVLHTINERRLRATSSTPTHGEAARRGWEVRKSILLYNYFLLCVNGPVSALHAFADFNQEALCPVAVTLGFLSYNTSNFLMYRLLLAKSELVEQGGEPRWILYLKRATWWYLHAVFLPASYLSVLYPKSLVSFTFGMEYVGGADHEHLVCAVDTTVLMMVMLPVTDTLLSGVLVGLFIHSLSNPLRSESDQHYRHAVCRTGKWAVLAMVSTMVFLVLTCMAISGGCTEYSGIVALSMVDLIINCVAINMTWDVRYYYKALNYLWPETFRELSPRLGRGDGHCDGIAGQPVPTGLRRLNGNMRDGNDGSVPMNGSETPRSVARSCNKERSCSPRRPDLSRQSVGFDSKMTNNKITVGSCASDFAMP